MAVRIGAVHHAPFERRELERLSAALSGFLPHTNLVRIALTGGVAVQLHCHRAGWPPARTMVADADFVAADVTAVSLAVSETRRLR